MLVKQSTDGTARSVSLISLHCLLGIKYHPETPTYYCQAVLLSKHSQRQRRPHNGVQTPESSRKPRRGYQMQTAKATFIVSTQLY